MEEILINVVPMSERPFGGDLEDTKDVLDEIINAVNRLNSRFVALETSVKSLISTVYRVPTVESRSIQLEQNQKQLEYNIVTVREQLQEELTEITVAMNLLRKEYPA